MSKSMLKALKQEKQQQDSKPLWYARGKCYDRRQVSDKQELAKAVSAIPKPEWSYFDLRLWEDATSDDQEQQVLVSGSRPVLVVHLEDTLVSSLILEDGSMLVSKRPGADSFLCSVAEEYELVLLSSSRPAAARAVMKQLLDPQLFSGQLHAKDVDAHDLNRLSSRQLVVTSKPEMSASNSDPDSVIVVPRYLADGRHEAEGQFMLLTKVLLHLATVPDDVWRLALKRVREQGVLRSIQSGCQDLGRVLGGSKNCIKVQVQRSAAAMTVVNGADPYLPRAPEDARPTLVLDLDETLVSSSRISTTDDPTVHLVTKRPGVEQFLAMVAGKFELVLWTASWQAYADAMVDKVLDPSGAGLFSHRLYAQHLVSDKKDLSKLGRRLDRVLVVDDSDWRYPQHLKDNLLLVPKYFGEEQDSELERVGKLLERLLASGVEDLRRGLVTASVNHA